MLKAGMGKGTRQSPRPGSGGGMQLSLLSALDFGTRN